jgi:hypothetical protein
MPGQGRISNHPRALPKAKDASLNGEVQWLNTLFPKATPNGDICVVQEHVAQKLLKLFCCGRAMLFDAIRSL